MVNGLLDVTHYKIKPTWSIRRIGMDKIDKRIDRFLLSKNLLDSSFMVCQWVGQGGDSDHLPVLLNIDGATVKNSGYFKLNPS